MLPHNSARVGLLPQVEGEPLIRGRFERCLRADQAGGEAPQLPIVLSVVPVYPGIEAFRRFRPALGRSGKMNQEASDFVDEHVVLGPVRLVSWIRDLAHEPFFTAKVTAHKHKLRQDTLMNERHRGAVVDRSLERLPLVVK